MRVLDPDLSQFTDVLTGPQPPTWAVVSGTALATWGVDASHAQPIFDRQYQLVNLEGDYQTYHLRLPLDTTRSPAATDTPAITRPDIRSVLTGGQGLRRESGPRFSNRRETP